MLAADDQITGIVVFLLRPIRKCDAILGLNRADRGLLATFSGQSGNQRNRSHSIGARCRRPSTRFARMALWREAERAGMFRGAPVDARDGFIHFSTAAQVARPRPGILPAPRGLVLIAVEADALGAALRWELPAAASCSRISMARCRSPRSYGPSRCRSAATADTSFRDCGVIGLLEGSHGRSCVCSTPRTRIGSPSAR